MAAALLVSVALHLALAWWFARAQPRAPVEVGARAATAIDVQIVQVPAPVSRAQAPAPEPVAREQEPREPEKTPPEPEKSPRESAQAPREPEKSPHESAQEPHEPKQEPRVSKREPAARPPETNAPPPDARASQQGSRAGAPDALAGPPGAPTQLDLTPRLGPAGDGPAGAGRTITNHPETAEEHGVAIAEEAGRVKGRVDGWLKGDIATRRVQLGLVDPYFGAVRGALQAAVEKNAPDGMPGKTVGRQLVDAVLGGAASYGATGNPYGEGQVPNASPAEREFTGHAEEMARRFPGSSVASQPSLGQKNMGRGPKMPEYHPQGLSTEQLQQCVVQGQQLDDFLAGKFGAGLFTVVSLRQAPDGKLLEVKLESSSGMPAYDRYVLTIAPTALEKLPPPPDHGFGITRGAGIKSVWRFEGRVKFKRPLKEWNAVTGALTTGVVSALYGLACPGLGPPLTFDAATGELELIDLAHPKFTCQVKLLRVE
jgi:TonB-like protein